MSPHRLDHCDEGDGFPRVSGDEPVSLEDFQTAIEFSPRERG